MTRAVTAQTLSQAVAEHLRLLIHRGEVGPGDRLPAERELAERLGVARISLREAIKILQAEGYVQVRRGAHGGTYVTELDEPAARWRARMRTESGEFDAIVDFRIAVETESARLAAIRRDQHDIAALEVSIEQLELADGRAAFRLADARFHAAVAAASGNARLGTAIDTSRAEMFVSHDILPYVNPIAESVRDHQAIFAAIELRDPELAAGSMRRHIEHTRSQLREIVFGLLAAEPDGDSDALRQPTP